jgi:hypothetical protein
MVQIGDAGPSSDRRPNLRYMLSIKSDKARAATTLINYVNKVMVAPKMYKSYRRITPAIRTRNERSYVRWRKNQRRGQHIHGALTIPHPKNTNNAFYVQVSQNRARVQGA